MSASELLRRKEERARKKELDDAKIAIFSSQFKKDDKKISDDDSDSDLAVEYYVDERGDPIRNVYFKNAKENLEPLRKVEAQGYRYEMLTPAEKELAYGLYRPLPEKLRKKLGVTIKAGKRIRRNHYKKTRKGKGRSKSKIRSNSKSKIRSNSKSKIRSNSRSNSNSNSRSNSKSNKTKRYSFRVKR